MAIVGAGRSAPPGVGIFPGMAVSARVRETLLAILAAEPDAPASRILDLLQAQKDKLKLYSSDSTVDRLASGEVAMYHVWNGATARATADRPTVIIASTLPGKGVSFLEGKLAHHLKLPPDLFHSALRELGGQP